MKNLVKAENRKPESSLMETIRELALRPDASVEMLERLINMEEKIIDRNAQAAFYADFVDAQQDMPAIIRDAKNKQTDSVYAKLETINKYLLPHIGKYGFGISFNSGPSEHADHVLIKASLVHREGHVEHYSYDSPFDMTGIAGKQNKTLTHGKGSAITYGMRYIVVPMWNLILIEDDDGNAANSEYVEGINGAQVKILRDMMKGHDDDIEESFLRYLGLDSIEDIKMAGFEKSKSDLRSALQFRKNKEPKK